MLKVAITILAECEGDLLMQEDFEALLTYLKVEPAQWPSQRLRRVLNAAICSPITAEVIGSRLFWLHSFIFSQCGARCTNAAGP